MARVPGVLALLACATALACAASAAGSAVALASADGRALVASDNAALWVSTAPTVGGNGTSCTQPGFSTISAAIQAVPSSGTINVCAGDYAEQLTITKPMTIVGHGKVVVQLPSVPANSATACDTAPGTAAYQPDQDGVVVCGAIKVSVTDLQIDSAWPGSTCDDSLYGVLIGGGATLEMSNSAITAAGAVPLNGCQGGIGIQDGMAWTTPNEVGHLILSDSQVSGYQKNGITVDGKGSTATITRVTVHGIGPTTQIAQNGIQVSNGALAAVLHSTVTGNECNYQTVCGPDALTQTQSTGLLFYGAAPDSTVTDSTISGNDIGVYYSANPAGKQPKAPQVLITGDKLQRNRYEGVVLDQGSAYVSHCSIESESIGIEVLQYGGTYGQTFGSTSVADFDTIRMMSWASVEVLSDRVRSDKPGKFEISNSHISSAPVRDNSKDLPVIRSHDT